MDSDTSSVLKRRITEFDETLNPLPRLSPGTLSSTAILEESQPTLLVVSSAKVEQESKKNTLNFFKKVKCSSNGSGWDTEDQQELVSEAYEEVFDSVTGRITVGDLGSGSSGSNRNSKSCARKAVNFGTEANRSENCKVGLVSDAVQWIEDTEESVNCMEKEKDCEESELNEVGVSGIQEFGYHVVSGDHKDNEMEKCEGNLVINYNIESHRMHDCASSVATFSERKESLIGTGTISEIVLEAKRKELDGRSVFEGKFEMHDSTSSVATFGERNEFLMGMGAESESVLDAGKKQLLLIAELTGGSIVEDRNCVVKGSGFEGDCIHKHVYKGNDGSVMRSIKLEVIDGTALIDSVLGPKNGNCVKRNGKKTEKQQGVTRKPRWTQKKAKCWKKVSETSEMPRNLTPIAVPLKDENGIRRRCSREEMEALRFVNIAEQRQMWKAIYAGLTPALVKEYDDLKILKQQKNFSLNFDSRRHPRRTSWGSVIHNCIG